MTLLDRVIGYLSPTRGLSRIQARAQAQVLLAYEGARRTRETSGWITAGTDANEETRAALATLRDRSRDLDRNNPFCSRAIDGLVSDIVGVGISCASATGNASLDRRLDREFAEWSEIADISGREDFAGLEELVCRTVLVSGEAVVRLRVVNDGSKNPLRIEVNEPDVIDSSRDGVIDGRLVIQGVEVDDHLRPTGYYLFGSPSNDARTRRIRASQSVRVDASSVVHVYRQRRPGQVRGVPVMSPVIVKSRQLDELSEAFLVRKKLEACIVGVRTRQDPLSAPTGIASREVDGVRVETFEPGMIIDGSPGEGIEFFDPKGTGGLIEHMRMELLAIAAGTGVMFEIMTGDKSQVNYSSYRAGRIDYARIVELYQHRMMIPKFCAPVRRRWLELQAVQIPEARDRFGASWTSPNPYASVDPEKEAKSDLYEMRAFLASPQEVIRRRGMDPRQVIAEWREFASLLDEMGLVSDADPRKTTRAGNPASAQQETEE